MCKYKALKYRVRASEGSNLRVGVQFGANEQGGGGGFNFRDIQPGPKLRDYFVTILSKCDF